MRQKCLRLARRPSARAIVAALGASLALLALAGPAGAVLSGRNGSIIFTSGREGANDNLAQLYRIIPNGSSGFGTLSPPLTGVGGQSRHPSWSPDRTKVVFANGTPGSPTTENYSLFVKDMVTGSVTPLIGSGSTTADHPAWSPDGTRIAYEQAPTAGSADRDIMVKTVGTAAPATQLTTSTATEFKPAWSPDSQTIYYAKANGNPQFIDIVRKPAGGGAETAVQAASGVDDYQPAISPDGTKLCFTLQTSPGGPASGSQTADIYITSLPTPGPIQKMSPDTMKGDIDCAWSPDGNRITYVNGTFGSGRLVEKPISDPTGQPQELADDQGSNNFDGNPDWAPDGSPDCPDTNVTATAGTPITINLECTDTGPAYEQTDPNGFVANGGEPTHGTTSDDHPTSNPSTVKYTPNAGFVGTDKITYTSFDGAGFGTDKGTVTITVKRKATPGGGEVFDGTAGNDTINGTPGPDVINCGAGDDTVNGGGGDDVINCGDGNDTVNGGDGNDTIRGENGNDRLRGGTGRDTINGNSGRDTINGDSDRDRLNGDDDRDRVNGDSGNDRVSGGSGSDRASGASGNDRVAGNSGNDRVSGGRGNDRVSGGSGNDRVGGDSGRDRVSGDSGRDRVSGGSGRDRLDGGRGRDRCDGGRGRDRSRRCERRRRIP